MKDLIEALEIFSKYIGDRYSPTHCEHDVFMVQCDNDKVSEEDKQRLEELSFSWDEDYECFTSYRFGSC